VIGRAVAAGLLLAAAGSGGDGQDFVAQVPVAKT
jgi:hypothetical protein